MPETRYQPQLRNSNPGVLSKHFVFREWMWSAQSSFTHRASASAGSPTRLFLQEASSRSSQPAQGESAWRPSHRRTLLLGERLGGRLLRASGQEAGIPPPCGVAAKVCSLFADPLPHSNIRPGAGGPQRSSWILRCTNTPTNKRKPIKSSLQ